MKKTDHPSTGEIMLRVRNATHKLVAARRQAVSQFDADLRRLSDLDMILSSDDAQMQPELFDVGSVLTPEIEQLLEAPLAKYN